MDVFSLIMGSKYFDPAVVSLMGGVAAAVLKGAHEVYHVLSILLVALVAGVWLSPLVVFLTEKSLAAPLSESVVNSITAAVAISSWDTLEAVANNRVVARLLDRIPPRRE